MFMNVFCCCCNVFRTYPVFAQRELISGASMRFGVLGSFLNKSNFSGKVNDLKVLCFCLALSRISIAKLFV